MENIYCLLGHFPAYGVLLHHPKPPTLDGTVTEEQQLSRLITTRYPSVPVATQSNTELEKYPSIRTWIKSTSWRVTYGNIQVGGQNAF